VILDAKRAEEYANVSVPFSKSVKLGGLKARTILKSGKAIDVKKGDIHERSEFPDFVLYADVREKVFAMPSFMDSCVIEYEFTRAVSGPQFEDQFRFDMEIPVRRAEYTFAVPSDFTDWGIDVATRSTGAPRAPVEGTRPMAEGALSTLTWTCTSLPAIPLEPLMPPFADLCSRVSVGLSRLLPDYPRYTWQSFGDDYYKETLAPLIVEGRALAEEARSFLRSPKSEIETIEMVANGVAGSTRYVAVELDGSGWEPHHPAEVFSAKYGDCKDMSMLTVALLRSLGVDAWPALLRTRDAGMIDTGIVTPSLMNHMIVFVRCGGEQHWLDPTAGVLRLGELPSMDRDAQALVLADTGCFFIRTPTATAAANRTSWNVSATIDESGSVVGDVDARFGGDTALEMRNLLRIQSRDDIRKMLESMLDGQFAGARVVAWEQADSEGGAECGVRLSFAADGVALEGDRTVLDGTTFGIAGPGGTLHSGERHHGVVFDRPYCVMDSCAIRIPSGWAADGLPEDRSISSKFGDYTRRYSQENGVLQCVRTFNLTFREVSASLYDELRDFWLAAGRVQREPVLLVRK
jgi:hypothetical protein